MLKVNKFYISYYQIFICLAAKDPKNKDAFFCMINDYKCMNNWIERNIIFPRIIQLQAELQKQLNHNQPIPITTRSIKQRKKASLNFDEDGPQCKRKNLSTHIRNNDGSKYKYSARGLPYLQEAQSDIIEQETCKAVKRNIAVDRIGQRKNMFHSNLPKSIIKKTKLHRDGSSQKQQKIVEFDNHPTFKIQNHLINKKSARAKQKTEPVQSIFFTEMEKGKQQQSNDCLKIKKAKNFNYNILTKDRQNVKESRLRRDQQMKRCIKMDDRSMMVDSIHGWNQEEDGLIQYSQAW